MSALQRTHTKILSAETWGRVFVYVEEDRRRAISADNASVELEVQPVLTPFLHTSKALRKVALAGLDTLRITRSNHYALWFGRDAGIAYEDRSLPSRIKLLYLNPHARLPVDPLSADMLAHVSQPALPALRRIIITNDSEVRPVEEEPARQSGRLDRDRSVGQLYVKASFAVAWSSVKIIELSAVSVSGRQLEELIYQMNQAYYTPSFELHVHLDAQISNSRDASVLGQWLVDASYGSNRGESPFTPPFTDRIFVWGLVRYPDLAESLVSFMEKEAHCPDICWGELPEHAFDEVIGFYKKNGFWKGQAGWQQRG